MYEIENYIKKEYWCSFKNNNRSLFNRSLWILGAFKYKNKKILNNIVEDVTVFYENNVRQLRGFNGNQPPLDGGTLKLLNSKDLFEFIEEYNEYQKKIITISKQVKINIDKNDFVKFENLFNKLIYYNCKINSYEYIINSLVLSIFESLSASEIKIFNKWKNNSANNNYSIYDYIFKYLKDHFKIDISINDLKLYSHVNEIRNIIRNKLKVDTLIKRINIRKKGFVLLNLNNKKYNNKIITNINIVNKIKKRLEYLENQGFHYYNNENFVKGKATFVSDIRLKGECVVIKNNYDIPCDYFNKILVCPITTTTDVHKYLDVKALIVDHGGFLSHAAIFSREIKKPCLMGCDIATKVFNTGDILEIDLEKEIVYKV